MFVQIEPIYFEEGSRIFQLVDTAYATSLVDVVLATSALVVSFAEETDAYVLSDEDKPISEAEEEHRVQYVEQRLRACCAGLLELSVGAFSPTETRKYSGFIGPPETSSTCLRQRLRSYGPQIIQHLNPIQYFSKQALQ